MHNPSYTINLEVPQPKKRGRPAKSVNKEEQRVIDTFAETLSQWDKKEKQVDFKDLCQKLQEALAKSYCDYEQLEKNVSLLRDEVIYRDVIIRYLESRKA